MNEIRGKIQNRERATQVRKFEGLRFGSITPTDIDGFIDFKNKAFVFIEMKTGRTEIKYGQRLALERLCQASLDSGKFCIGLIASHYTRSDEDIDCASAEVSEIWHNGKWHKRSGITLKKQIDNFLLWAKIKPEEKANQL